MSHGEVFLTDREDLGDLLWCPDGEMAESEAGAVKYVGESSDLVLLVLQQGLQQLELRSHWVDLGLQGAGSCKVGTVDCGGAWNAGIIRSVITRIWWV